MYVLIAKISNMQSIENILESFIHPTLTLPFQGRGRYKNHPTLTLPFQGRERYKNHPTLTLPFQGRERYKNHPTPALPFQGRERYKNHLHPITPSLKGWGNFMSFRTRFGLYFTFHPNDAELGSA